MWVLGLNFRLSLSLSLSLGGVSFHELAPFNSEAE